MLVLLAAASGASTAHAANDGWNGEQPATLTGGILFTFGNTPDTIIVKQAATPTFMTIAGKFTNAKVLGLSGIWIVGPNGTTMTGVQSINGGSLITGPAPTPDTSWGQVDSPEGYYAGPGYGSNTSYIQLASNADLLAGAGKSPSGYTQGVFTFTGISNLNDYKIGFDYLVASPPNGQTGRGFATTTINPPIGITGSWIDGRLVARAMEARGGGGR
ncbi:MAG: hypothetical protein V4671_31995, partial [Armatimonadota bacterium]